MDCKERLQAYFQEHEVPFETATHPEGYTAQKVAAALFVLLLIWRFSTVRLDVLAVVFLCLFVFFLFYAVNYRTLVIRLTPERLVLRFGLFTWKVPLDNVEACRLDDVPTLTRLGGAGIHFLGVRGRYRASFNFLEHLRLWSHSRGR